MRPFKTAIEAALLRGIAAAAELDAMNREKPILVVEEIRSVDWASITFIGVQHTFELRFDGDPEGIEEAIQALALRIPDWEFRIPGQIVADIELASVETLDTSHCDPGEVSNSGPSTMSRSFVVNAFTIVD
jgi:hypothetical protein